jgi:eukaryotic-like serine/threonine-protein kinase
VLTPEIGNVYDDKYKLLEGLGHGGFASVFLAEDVTTKEKVVLKFPDITQLGDPAVYERFRREMAIGKLLNHPDLPIALSYSEGNPPYLVIKYAEGESLANIIQQEGRFSVDEVVGLAINLLEALDYCHQRGVYHRDIKPENLLLGTDGHIKIIDFGIAMMEGSPRVTYRGFSGLMGTPEYMSPEQIKGERGRAKSDIYAVGCLIYNMLSGNPPFTGDNPLTTMYQHMTADVKPLTDICPDLNPGIWAAIKKSLRRRKEERYDTAIEMANDLRNPDKVDLSWIKKADPPLASAITTKKTHWILLTTACIIVVGLVFLILLLSNK